MGDGLANRAWRALGGRRGGQSTEVSRPGVSVGHIEQHDPPGDDVGVGVGAGGSEQHPGADDTAELAAAAVADDGHPPPDEQAAATVVLADEAGPDEPVESSAAAIAGDESVGDPSDDAGVSPVAVEEHPDPAEAAFVEASVLASETPDAPAELVSALIAALNDEHPDAAEAAEAATVTAEAHPEQSETATAEAWVLADEAPPGPVELVSTLIAALNDEHPAPGDTATYRRRAGALTANDVANSIPNENNAIFFPQGVLDAGQANVAHLQRGSLTESADEMRLGGWSVPVGYVAGSVRLFISYDKTASSSTDSFSIGYAVPGKLAETTIVAYGTADVGAAAFFGATEATARRIDNVNAAVRAFLDTATAADLVAGYIVCRAGATAVPVGTLRVDGVIMATEHTL